MTNGSDQISPIQTTERVILPYSKEEVEVLISNDGLTKREHFAALALQGLCANYLRENVTGWDIKTYATEAVAIADALINQLNKAPQI